VSTEPTITEIAATLEVAALAPGTSRDDVRGACRDARELGCPSVCVAPAWVPEAVAQLQGSEVAVSAVVGFPLGATTVLAKVFEALECLKAGASELDVVLHVGAVRSGDLRSVRREASELVQRTREATHKLILEMGLLSPDQLRKVAKAAAAANPAYFKTGTGTTGPPVTPDDVKRLRSVTPAAVRIKASGGIRTRHQALDLLAAGADRLGTSAPRDVLA
jgi:deoxyribose-phosphate aldolase